MKLYPIYLKLENQSCVVFGGGKVATRKVLGLLNAGARVTVISPDLSPELFKMWTEGTITCHYRPYHRGDVQGYVLAVSATNILEVNQQIAAEAREAGVFVNVVDVPELCDFYLPAIVQRGDLQIAISTNGIFPALAREIRKYLEKEFDESLGDVLRLAGQIRLRLQQKYPNPEQRQKIVNEIVVPKILESLKKRSTEPMQKEWQKWI